MYYGSILCTEAESIHCIADPCSILALGQHTYIKIQPTTCITDTGHIKRPKFTHTGIRLHIQAMCRGRVCKYRSSGPLRGRVHTFYHRSLKCAGPEPTHYAWYQLCARCLGDRRTLAAGCLSINTIFREAQIQPSEKYII